MNQVILDRRALHAIPELELTLPQDYAQAKSVN